ncbi:MAG TPA: flavodoxin, partial [Clostridiales bacterium]|nr:flavodoxin [Clostridiales bacterium]
TGFFLYSIKDSIKKQEKAKIHSGDPLVFVVPTYAWRIPKVVEEWIRSTDFTGNKKAYFIMTCGDDNGNAGKYLEQLCKDKQFVYMGCDSVVMPENYIAMFNIPSEEESIQIVIHAAPVISQIAKEIKEGGYLHEKKVGITDHLKSGIINTGFYLLFVHARKFLVTDSCIGCGICVDACPLDNIYLEDEKPIWANNCTHCMACICDCPTQAIEYGSASKGKRRYHCPL